MPFDTIEEYLSDILQNMQDDRGELLWPPEFAGDDDSLVQIVTKADFSPLGLGVNKICSIVYDQLADATPASFGGAHDRWYTIDWKPEIWCLFKPAAVVGDIIEDTQRAEAFNLSVGNIVNAMITGLLQYQNFPGYNDQYIKAYRDSIGRETPDSPSNHQVVWTQPLLENGAAPREFVGQSGIYSGTIITYLVREAFIQERRTSKPFVPTDRLFVQDKLAFEVPNV